MTTTVQLLMAHLVEGQGTAEVTVNDALNILDAVAQLAVKDRDLTTPPGSPVQGDRYIPGPSSTGAWSGHDGELAIYLNGWVFRPPRNGWLAYIEDESVLLRHNGTIWTGLEDTADGLTAFSGGGQASATQLIYGFNRATTVGAGADSVKLPPAIDGTECMFYNAHATNAVAVFPQTGESINNLSANVSRTIGTARGSTFRAVGTVWLQT